MDRGIYKMDNFFWIKKTKENPNSCYSMQLRSEPE